MGVNPSYYRQAGEVYPHNAIFLTQFGTFPLGLEHYLGQGGADSVSILKRQDPLRQVYAPFVRYQNKKEFVDYTKPRVNAFYTTFVIPATLGKKTVKVGKQANSLAPFVSLIGGIIICASLYVLVRDAKIISNSIRMIQKSKSIQKYLADAKKALPSVIDDPVFQNLNKVAILERKFIKGTLLVQLSA